MSLLMILGVGMLFFVAGALGAFFFDKVVLAWNYFVAQVLYFPQSYHDLRGENITLKQELEYSKRHAGALRVNIDSLMVKVKVSEHFLTLTSEQLQAKGKVEADLQYLQRQEAFYKEQLEEVHRELAAEYEYGAKLKEQLLGSQRLSDELADKLSVAIQNNKPKRKSSRSFPELHRGRKS